MIKPGIRAEAGRLPRRCRIDSGGSRAIPLSGDTEGCRALFNAPRAVGCGRVSVEGKIHDPAARIRTSVPRMRELSG